MNFKTEWNCTPVLSIFLVKEREIENKFYICWEFCPDVYFIQYSNSINMHEIHILVFKKIIKKILFDFNNPKNILLFFLSQLKPSNVRIIDYSQGIFILSCLFYPICTESFYLFLSVYLFKRGIVSMIIILRKIFWYLILFTTNKNIFIKKFLIIL